MRSLAMPAGFLQLQFFRLVYKLVISVCPSAHLSVSDLMSFRLSA